MQFFIFFKRIILKILTSFKKCLNFIFNKKILKIAFCAIAIFFLLFSPSIIFNKRNYELNLNEYLNLSNSQKIVLNMWHVESFEGGTNSMGKYLERQVVKFNKQNSNCFISVKTMTEEQLYLNLKENKYPDLFSFGIGSGYMLPSLLSSLDKNDLIRKDLTNYGSISSDILAYPFLLSGYCAISKSSLLSGENFSLTNGFNNVTQNKKQIRGIGFSTSGITNASYVLLSNGVDNIKQENFYTCGTTYEAYTNFLSNKFVTLVGTARDVARCKNRENNGTLSSCSYNYLSGYSDLIQYVGVCNKISKTKIKASKLFASFLLTESCQNDIKNYGLFSTTKINLYDSGYMYEFEQVLKKELKSINVFSNLNTIEKNKQDSLNKLFSKTIT